MKKYFSVSLMTGIALGAGLIVAVPALAQTSVSVSASAQGNFGGYGGRGGSGMRGNVQPGIFGTVTAIDGTTLTVTGTGRPTGPMPENASTSGQGMWQGDATTTVYTVDGSDATVYKGSPTSSVPFSDIVVNDKVFVQGTVNGTNVAAVTIRDGVTVPMGNRQFGPGKGGFGHGSSTTSTAPYPIQGNGEPVVAGNVTAISGDTLTVTNASNVTYTIDASNATIVVHGVTSTVTSIADGDAVVVQGVVNGTSITASSVIDQGAPHTGNASSTGGVKAGGGFSLGFGGIFGAIGGFFKHLFGF